MEWSTHTILNRFMSHTYRWMNDELLQNDSRKILQSVFQFHHLNTSGSAEFKYLNQIRRSDSGRIRPMSSQSNPSSLSGLSNRGSSKRGGSNRSVAVGVPTGPSGIPTGVVGKLHVGHTHDNQSDRIGTDRIRSEQIGTKETKRRNRVCGSCNSVCEKHAKAVCEKCFKKYLMI